ncbi:hypothetical protein [uncultured Campylobacter sp.]|uniref:hypothetical protein n=1 Tax=uncultured Campylobacter sp. TaxID=218934 RepID=UPI0026101F8E|nr:hypothetical protein [uncultured Campylobacter sp.]
MKYVLSAVLAALFLAGCGEDEVELVKNYTLPDFKSMSIGTAIEGSKICKSVTWSKEENGGLKTVKMVCDADMEKVLANIIESNKKREQDMLDSILDSAMAFYGGKTYDKQGLLKLANEHCKINDTKFQEMLKSKGEIDYGDQKMLVDCDDKLKDEILKPGDSRIAANSMSDIIKFLKEAAYLSQLTPEQEKAQLGKAAKLSSSTIELNFVVNTDNSVSLSNKFKFTQDGKEDSNNRISSKKILAGFYER